MINRYLIDKAIVISLPSGVDTVYKSQIKGRQLLDNGSLIQMLKYHATQYFVQTFNQTVGQLGQQGDLYPPNETLLSSAIKYNNTVAFNLLVSNTNMASFNEASTILALRSCNLDILQGYIAMNGNGYLTAEFKDLCPALGRDSLSFIELALQHFDIEGEAVLVLNKPGIRLEVVRLLHQYNILNQSGCLLTVLNNAANNNMIDCVRYMMDSLPAAMTMANNIPKNLLKISIEGGFSDMFEYLTALPGMSNVFDDHHWGSPVFSRSIANGHVDFVERIKQLFVPGLSTPYYIQRYTSYIDEALNIRRQQNLGTRVDDPMYIALANEDVDKVRQILDGHGQKKVKVYLRLETHPKLSLRMVELLVGHESCSLQITEQDISNMIHGINRPGNAITEEAVKLIIQSCNIKSSHYHNIMMRQATRVSLSLLEFLHSTLGCSYTPSILVEAIRYGQADIMEHLYQLHQTWIVDSQDSIDELITKGSLQAIKVLFKYRELSAEDVPNTLIKAIDNPSSDVFEFIIDNIEQRLRYDYTTASDLLQSMVNRACEMDRHLILMSLHRRINRALPMPFLSILENASQANAYHSLEYIFVTNPSASTFANMTKLNSHRTITAILHVAYDQGHTRIILMLDKLLKDIAANKKRKQDVLNDETDCNMIECAVPAAQSQRMDTAFHTLFRDKRLCMMIMGYMGKIYRTLFGGVKPIKGHELQASDELMDYIWNGASSWFIDAYNTVASTYPPNKKMIEVAMCQSDTNALERLLANPNMTLDDHPDSHNTPRYLALNLSRTTKSCESLAELLTIYMDITCRAHLDISGRTMLFIQRPAFIRALLKVGATIERPDDDKNSLQHMMDSWLIDPWGLEMIQLLNDNSLLSPYHLRELLTIAVRHSATPIVKYLLDIGIVNREEEEEESDVEQSQPIIVSAAESGDMDILDLVLTVTPHKQIPRRDWEDAFCKAASGGHTSVAIKIYDLINLQLPGFARPLKALSMALAAGHLDIVNFIIDAPLPIMDDDDDDDGFNEDGEDKYLIVDIHHSILSQRLIRKLLSIPSLTCRFDKVMARAILKGDRELINMLELNEQKKFQTDYRVAMGTAAIVGDDTTVKMIIEKRRRWSPLGRLRDKDHDPDDDTGSVLDSSGDNEDDDDNNDDDEDEKPIWNYIQPSVGHLLIKESPITNSDYEVCEVIDSFDKPNSKMTEELALEFIKSFLDNTPGSHIDFTQVLGKAATKSLAFIKPLHEYLLGKTNNGSLYSYQSKLFKLIIEQCSARGDIAAIEYLLGAQMDALILRKNLQLVVDSACNCDQVDLLKFVHTRWALSNAPQHGQQHGQLVPSLKSLYSAADINKYNVLSYLIGDTQSPGPLLTSMEPLHLTRALKLIRQQAYDTGCMRIIRMCNKVL
ncbi:hypothetical protein SAMD00019534_070440 [Acytostelium subglobosum LB1]|uniref:hypothetical protein n=1 Tax=Acytostelium subglobosum LB1 TaxID=1410327 RepID=UPI00064488B9|nr:hypothetical protein SAMD00019534_070440 [Acytostelium subglobosum LB1]GAM23869.1 hypothetical protein SAMD00019534_070440 [Acytostelium subglobosum LB1]|eukprot:XP_012752905.1 hypothetical protein SAMD00019534_070440 [Acytostelium subglobosum LB1]